MTSPTTADLFLF